MTDFKANFEKISTIFKSSDLWKKMVDTVEDSPWHREANVAVHTEMVVAEYVSRSPEVWTVKDFAGALACLFHDVGKPSSMVMKFKEERGHYKAFHGHEKVSARMFMDFVMSTPSVRYLIEDHRGFFFVTAWMIEYHLPWDIKDQKKRDMLFRTCYKYFRSADIFARVVISDTYGRISDDSEIKRAKSDAWCEQFTWEFESKKEFMRSLEVLTPVEKKKHAFILIGASGSGKSTFKSKHMKDFPNTKTYSLDDLRHEFYGKDYDLAFRKSCEDNHFKPKAKDRFMDMIRDKDTEMIIIDNVHSTKKTRVMYIDEMQRRGFDVAAVVFVTSRNTVVKRQKTRTDKCVPEEAVLRQYDSVELPSIGEVDNIFVEFGE